MKNRELIKQLLDYNLDAEISVIAHCKEEEFTITFGSSEGGTKSNCDTVSLYVDSLCSNESQEKIICPECMEETPLAELNVFGGLCERCAPDDD